MADSSPTADPSPVASPPGPDDRGRSRDEVRARLRAAALDAERDTGRRERTREKAKRNVIVRVGIITLGTLVTLAGVGMLVLPGPGIVVVIAGLGILATEVTWAERLLAYAKSKAKVDQVTAQRPWIKPVSIAITVVGVAISIAYAVFWR